MRNNGPITQHEYVLPAGTTLVSTTDLQNHLTYCNPAFVEVSGYARAELIGQPHNLVRHPDMPAEAFRDMWATLKANEPWTALVKSRRKNGDHYCVRANVTPVLEGGRLSGYMSVRTTPSRNEVAAAEALYRQMRDEANRGGLVHTLCKGDLQTRGAGAALQRWLHPGLGSRIALAVMAGMTAVAVASGPWGRPGPAVGAGPERGAGPGPGGLDPPAGAGTAAAGHPDGAAHVGR